MLSLRAVTLLFLWFCLVSLMPAEKHLLIETKDEKPDQNKAWGGGINWWPSPFESSLEAQDGQSSSNKKGMTDISQKKDSVVRNRVSIDTGFWKHCMKFFSEKYCDDQAGGGK